MELWVDSVSLPGIPARFRLFFSGFGGAIWFTDEETLASPEAVDSFIADELSKSAGMEMKIRI